ncbi:MAG TPA: phosphoglycerate kinase [Candidatus Paceibacterota bacterium]|nr:phosphoglycerate kinase [Candidatus Paceibacterota bacterium]
MRSVRDIPALRALPVLVRAALNEPVSGGEVGDTFRLRRALPTLSFLQEAGARVVVASHIDPPGGAKASGAETLAPVAKKLGELLPRTSFCPTTADLAAREAVRAMAPGDILVLENLRRDPGEVKNDPDFANRLAALADAFVEDSFDTCHRRHASIVSLPTLLPAYAGLTLLAEVENLTAALAPASPSLAIIGGAKFSTKEPVVAALLARYDRVFVGGALANDFIKAKGFGVGASLLSAPPPPLAKMHALVANPKLLLPLDARVARKGEPASAARVAALGDIAPEEMILDHGPATEALLASVAGKAQSILWNGPLGNYENGFTQATDALAVAIARSGAHSVVGGGDTIAAIEALDILDKFSFVSTGGGAMLDFLTSGTLPGIAALG